MADAKIVIDTELKTDKLKNKLDKLNNDIERQTGKIKELDSQYKQLLSGEGTPTVNPEFERLNKQLEKAKAALAGYNEELKRIQDSTDLQLKGINDDDMVGRVLDIEQIEVDNLNEKYAKQLAELERIKAAMDALPESTEDTEKTAEKLRLELERAQIALERMEGEARSVETQIDNVRPPASEIHRNIENANKSLSKFEKRLQTLAKKVFVFTVITAILRKMKAYLSEALEANAGFQASLATLKGTLRTAFQPILSFVIPILQALINILSIAVSYIAKFTSWIAGTTVDASSKAAQALYDQSKATKAAGAAAEKAKKQMSGLDEMNTWQSESASGGGAADLPTTDFGGIKSEMSELEIYLSGALLAIGAVLAFTGASIPLGIALMVIGAAGLANALSVNWDKMPKEIRSALTKVLLVLGAAALVIGAILAFTGASIPLGIGLMIAGAAAIGTAAALNWNYLKKAISGDLAFLMGTVGAALLVLGIILVATGAALPLGIALIMAGAIGLITPIALNWNVLKDKIAALWESIKSWWKRSVAPKFTLAFWKSKFSSIAEGLKAKIKDGINAAIALFNTFINWINKKMHISWNALKIAGLTVIPSGSFQLLRLKNIPQLAQGAVIPANREFLAVLGDQKHGNNIEAPESLIRKIVREEGGGGSYTFIAQLDGRTIFKEVIDQGKLSRRMTGKNAFALGGG